MRYLPDVVLRGEETLAEYQSFGWTTRAFGRRRPVTRTVRIASTIASMSVPAEPTVEMPEFRMGR